MNRPAVYGALTVAAALTSPVLANDGDAVRGAELFPIRCIECHAIGETTDKKIGPNLKGLIGRTSGSLEGFEYSDAMKGAGIVWSENTLKSYLVAPRKLVPGTKMNFNGLKRPGEVEDIVAYLLEVGRKHRNCRKTARGKLAAAQHPALSGRSSTILRVVGSRPSLGPGLLGSALKSYTRLIKLRLYTNEVLVNAWSTHGCGFKQYWKCRNLTKHDRNRQT